VTQAHASTGGGGRSYQVVPGDTLDGFDVESVLSKGGMGSVFKAQERATGRTVVLKVPHLHLESDVVFFSRFEREEKIGLRLNHPFIATVLRVHAKSRPYLVMEYVEGTSLYQLMTTEGRLPVERVLAIGRQICEALVYMHAENVVHRDLKPENILLDEQGRIRLIDFGIALDFAARRLTWGRLSSRMGTPEYMAPEQIRGHRGDDRVDLYALGLILYEMIAGVTPYEAPTLSALIKAKTERAPRPLSEAVPGIDPHVSRVIMQALAVERADRYSSAVEMLGALTDPSSAVTPAPSSHRVGAALDRLRPAAVWFFVFATLIALVWFGSRPR
jgi:serine/threonine protein kinase